MSDTNATAAPEKAPAKKAPPAYTVITPADAEGTVTISDTKGNHIQWRDPDLSEKMDVYEAAGPVNVANAMWLGTAMLSAGVRQHRGKPVPFPTTKAEVKALTKQIGQSGIDAIIEYRKTLDADTGADLVVAKN